MAEDVKKVYATIKVYFGNKPNILARYIKLAIEHPSISVSGMIVTAAEACIDTFEKALRDGHRKFTLNGKVVEK